MIDPTSPDAYYADWNGKIVTRTNTLPAAKRSRLVVEIKLDPVPGWGNDPEDHRAHVQRLLDASVGHYEPTVTVVAPPVPEVTVLTPVTLTDAERGHAFEHFGDDETHMGRCYLEADVERIVAARLLEQATR